MTIFLTDMKNGADYHVKYFQIIIFSLFTIDIYCNFHTGFYRTGRIIKDKTEIFVNYKKILIFDIMVLIAWIITIYITSSS